MVVVIINENQWELVKPSFINKDAFKEIVYRTLIDNLNDYHCEDCKIVLPNTVTTAERHKLHILTKPGFTPRSKGENSNRFMEIFIDADFFEELHNIFKPVDKPVDRMFIIKKAILDDIMGIVEKHFNEIFLKYYV